MELGKKNGKNVRKMSMKQRLGIREMYKYNEVSCRVVSRNKAKNIVCSVMNGDGKFGVGQAAQHHRSYAAGEREEIK